MSKRLLTILLLVSLFLNAGIIGGLIVMGIFRHNHNLHHYVMQQPQNMQRREMPGFGPRIPEDPKIIALRDSFRSTKDELMSELAKDPVNEARINAIIDKSVANQSAMELALGHKMLELRKGMNADEAREYFGRHQDRMERYQNRRKPNE
ncbi:MAG TPA: hypothetical protein PLG20_00835 [Candidatus Syntrophosphaera sp.]|jgi:hypothetical protein|nr:hypothetical protein [Candidatus Syntrophosphaera sp.]